MANAKDLANGEKSCLSLALLDRLRLTDARIEAMAKGVREVAGFAEVVGENLGGWSHLNGMQISRICVPLGGARYRLALFDLLWWQAKLESRSKSQICLTLYAFLLLFEIVAPSTLRLKFLMNLEKFSKLSLSEKKRSFISFWLSFFKNLRE